jgi:hypothetical protein
MQLLHMRAVVAAAVVPAVQASQIVLHLVAQAVMVVLPQNHQLADHQHIMQVAVVVADILTLGVVVIPTQLHKKAVVVTAPAEQLLVLTELLTQAVAVVVPAQAVIHLALLEDLV